VTAPVAVPAQPESVQPQSAQDAEAGDEAAPEITLV
jgi:hypothetical protein